MNFSSERVVVSSMNTSSRSVVFWMAWSMEAVGVVVTSERKSKAAGLEVEPQAWPLVVVAPFLPFISGFEVLFAV